MKPSLEIKSMSGWSIFYTLLASLCLVAAAIGVVAMNIAIIIGGILASLPFFATAKLFECVTSIMKNQEVLLNEIKGKE